MAIQEIDISQIIRNNSNPLDRWNEFRSQLEALSNSRDVIKFIPEGTGRTLELFIDSRYSADTPIYAPRQIDGNNWTISIKNDHEFTNPWLFYIRKNNNQAKKCFHITPDQVDSGDYSKCEQGLLSGKKIIIVKDNCDWVKRTDPSDSAIKYRSDAILLVNGKAMNKPIQPYNTPESAMSSFVFCQDDIPVFIKNLNLIRNTQSAAKLGLVTVRGYDNVNFEKINVRFSNGQSIPQVNISNDEIFSVYECTNIKFSEVNVNGTYSSMTSYGYAFSIHTATNVVFDTVTAKAIWGCMGTNCINNILVRDSELNRFDVHYYGKNARIYNTVFENVVEFTKNYNRVGCFYGELLFEECIFKQFIPMQFDSSFNIYTGFNLIFKSCEFNNWSGTVINAGIIGVETPDNIRRTNLKKMCWPNVHIRDLILSGNNPSKIKMFVLNNSNNINVPISYISHVSISHVSNTGNNPSGIEKQFCNYIVRTETPVTSRCGNNDYTLTNLPTT